MHTNTKRDFGPVRGGTRTQSTLYLAARVYSTQTDIAVQAVFPEEGRSLIGDSYCRLWHISRISSTHFK